MSYVTSNTRYLDIQVPFGMSCSQVSQARQMSPLAPAPAHPTWHRSGPRLSDRIHGAFWSGKGALSTSGSKSTADATRLRALRISSVTR